jgi:hypothetical protein
MSRELFRRRTLIMHGLIEGDVVSAAGKAFGGIKRGISQLGGSMFRSGALGAQKSIGAAKGNVGATRGIVGSKPWGDVQKASGLGDEAMPSSPLNRLKMGLGKQIAKRPGLALGGAAIGAGAIGVGAENYRRNRRGY